LKEKNVLTEPLSNASINTKIIFIHQIPEFIPTENEKTWAELVVTNYIAHLEIKSLIGT
jgi:hypothetical protein